MTIRVVTAVLAAGLCLGASGAFAEEAAIPDLKGTWSGTFTGGVRLGGGDLAPADLKPTFVPAGDQNRLYTLTIAEQNGRGLIGTWASVNGSEPIHGVIRMDGKTVLFVDSDSYMSGTVVSPTELEFCNQTTNGKDMFAFCFLLKKE